MNDKQATEVSDLVEEHGEMVFATAYRILGNPADAEDTLQEVFLKLLRQRNRLAKRLSVKEWGAYLRVMATRKALDLVRKRRRRREVGAEWVEAAEGPANQGPRHLLLQHEAAEMLRRALARLPRREAHIFSLRHFDEFTYQEIADQLGLSVNSVGVHLHRARRRLRDIVEPWLSIEPQPACVTSRPTA